MASSGVVKVTFNRKARNTSQFYYNMSTEKPEDIKKKFRDVVEDYFNWYSDFQNKDVITEFELYSSDFLCISGCKIPMNQKLTVVDILMKKDVITDIIKEVAEKYQIGVDI
jgi:hypothetical protein